MDSPRLRICAAECFCLLFLSVLAPSGPNYLLIKFHSQLSCPQVQKEQRSFIKPQWRWPQGWEPEQRQTSPRDPEGSLRAKTVMLADTAPNWRTGHSSCSNHDLNRSSLERSAPDGLPLALKRTQQKEI